MAIRFLADETVVSNGRVLAAFKAGQVVSLPRASEQRWLRRGKAEQFVEVAYEDVPRVDVPEDWRTMKWFSLRKLARDISGRDVSTKADAEVVIENYLR